MSWDRPIHRTFKKPECRRQARSFRHRIRYFGGSIGSEFLIDKNQPAAGIVKWVRDWPFRRELIKLALKRKRMAQTRRMRMRIEKVQPPKRRGFRPA